MQADRSGVHRALAEHGVTPREAEVLDALAERLTNAEMAAQLHVSERTVESHVSSLLRKLRAHDRRVLGEMAKALREAEPEARRPLPSMIEMVLAAGPCVGRGEALAGLGRAWETASQGHTRLVVVTGDGGIGKSRLVAELASEVHEVGAQVLLGSCHEDLQVPFQPFAELLTREVDDIPPDEIRRRAGTGAALLVPIAPRLADVLETGSTSAQESRPLVEAAEDRAGVFSAVHGYLARAAERAPLLVIVEDIHWAAASTLDLVRHLARSGGRDPILLVVTARATVPELGEALGQLLADVARLPSAGRIDLAGLGVEDIGEVLKSLGSAADPAWICEQAVGNPLFARELAAAGGKDWTPAAASMVARRQVRLDDPDRDLLDVAAVVGPRFHAGLLAGATHREVVDVVESLERCEAAGLVVAVRGRPGMFEHTHALFRSARLAALITSRRMHLHHQVLDALEARGPDDSTLTDLARHACMAAPLVEPLRAIERAQRAAKAAERSMAFDEAARIYERALEVEQLCVPAAPHTRLQLAIGRGRVLNRMGDPRHRALLLDAAALARRLDDHEALAQVVWAMSQDATPHDPGQRDADLAQAAEHALVGLPQRSAPRARTLAALATDSWLSGERTRARELVHDAIETADALDDDVLLAQVLMHTRAVRWVPGQLGVQQQTADRLVATGLRSAHSSLVAQGLSEHALAALEAGEMAAFDRALEALVEALDHAQMPFSYLRAQLIGFRSTRLVWAGDLDGAERVARELATLADRSGMDPALLQGPLTIVIEHNRGHLARRLPALESFLTEARPGFRPYSHGLLALAYAHADRPGDASATMHQLLDQTRGWAPDAFWLAGRVYLAEVAEMLADEDAGGRLGQELQPFAGVMAGFHHGGTTLVDLARAQCALAAEDVAAARGIASVAVDHSRSQGMPLFLARSLLRFARACRGPGGAHESVAACVDEAMSVGETTGAGLISQEAARLGLL